MTQNNNPPEERCVLNRLVSDIRLRLAAEECHIVIYQYTAQVKCDNLQADYIYCFTIHKNYF